MLVMPRVVVVRHGPGPFPERHLILVVVRNRHKNWPMARLVFMALQECITLEPWAYGTA